MSTYDSGLHEAQCENAEYFYCRTCRELVHDSSRNQCPVCLRFIPRIEECICDMLPKPEPDWDAASKEQRLEV
jgi:hypothetical protein